MDITTATTASCQPWRAREAPLGASREAQARASETVRVTHPQKVPISDCDGSSHDELKIWPALGLLTYFEMNSTQKLSAVLIRALATVCITRKESYLTEIIELHKKHESRFSA